MAAFASAHEHEQPWARRERQNAGGGGGQDQPSCVERFEESFGAEEGLSCGFVDQETMLLIVSDKTKLLLCCNIGGWLAPRRHICHGMTAQQSIANAYPQVFIARDIRQAAGTFIGGRETVVTPQTC